MKGKLLFTLIVLWTLVFSACSASESDTLPTLVPTIAFPTQTPAPTNTPAPTATFETSNNAESLVRRVAGNMMVNQSLQIERYTAYKEEIFPDGRIGYEVDFSFNSPQNYTREEILQLAYALMHEFYFNFSEANVMYVSLLVTGEQFNPNCNLGLGVGYITATNFLPEKMPEDLEAWFSFFVEEQYFGDLPGESQALLAYGNDPALIPLCTLEEWQR